MLSLLLLYRAQIAPATVGEITEVFHLELDGRAGAGVLGGVSLVRRELYATTLSYPRSRRMMDSAYQVALSVRQVSRQHCVHSRGSETLPDTNLDIPLCRGLN